MLVELQCSSLVQSRNGWFVFYIHRGLCGRVDGMAEDLINVRDSTLEALSSMTDPSVFSVTPDIVRSSKGK